MKNERLVLVLLVIVAGLPFLNQAFHIDDRIYLEVAENTLANPLFPYDYPPLFEGLRTPDAASHSHLPLVSYYLAGIRLLTGSEQEWLYHLAFLIFPVLAVLAVYELAGRYVESRLAAACAVAAGPGFMVLSHTLMTEVPLLAFWTLAASRFLRIAESDRIRPGDVLICALSLLAASFISLISVGLVVLLAAFLVVQRLSLHDPDSRTTPYRVLGLLLLLPLVLWVLWYLRAYLHYDRFLLVRTLQHLEKREAFSLWLMGQKLLTLVLNTGAAFLFPAAVWLLIPRRRLWLLPLALLSLLLALPLVPLSDWTWQQISLLAVFWSTGVVLIGGFLVHCSRLANRSGASPGNALADASLLFFWFMGIGLAYVLLYPSGSVRYALLLGPPLVIGWVHGLEGLDLSPYLKRNLIWLMVALTAALGLTVSVADYRYAGLYRSQASQLVGDYAAPGRSVWFTAEWGLRHYLEAEGAKPLRRISTDPEAGDIIIKPYLAPRWVTLYDGNTYTDLLEQRYMERGFPVRTQDFASHAGFYSTAWGILPYSWAGEGNWEWFNVFRVKKKYYGPVPEEERHY